MTSASASRPPSFLHGYFLPVLARVGLPLFAWSLFTQFTDQQIINLMQDELASKSGAGPRLWVFGGLSMFLSLFAPLVSLILILHASRSAQGENLFEFLRQRLSYLFREQLRAAGKMLLWGFLLILPGLLKFFEYALVPFVVCLDPRYQRGELDALAAARGVFYRRWPTVLGILLGFACLSLMMTGLDTFRSFTDHPIIAAGLVGVDVLIFILLQWALLRLWEKDYAHVQLAGN